MAVLSIADNYVETLKVLAADCQSRAGFGLEHDAELARRVMDRLRVLG